MNFERINISLSRTTASLFLLVSSIALAGVGDTERVSLPDPETGNAESNANSQSWVDISEDGQLVFFQSGADNLVDTPVIGPFNHIYVRDRSAGTTELITVDINGDAANNSHYAFDATPDGRFVAWESFATTLDGSACSSNGNSAIFIRDRANQSTECISFHSDGTTVANGRSGSPVISADGNVVAYLSNATNLVAGDLNGTTDVFVHFRDTGETRRVNVSSSGQEANGKSFKLDLSQDGKFVVFDSDADNLVANDMNNSGDLFLHDLDAGTTRLLVTTSSGDQLNEDNWAPRISADGNHVTFLSGASNLAADVGGGRMYVHEIDTGVNEAVHVNSNEETGTGGAIWLHDISRNGRYVVMRSNSPNLDPRNPLLETHYFIRDRHAGTTWMVDVNNDGEKASPTFSTGAAAISNNGRFVAFESPGTNLVDGDTNNSWDVFVHQLRPFSPPEMIEEIISLIIDLNLHEGIANSLDAKLNTALDALEDMNENNDVAACNSLDALINAVEAQRDKKIDSADADEIIDRTLEVKAELGCT